MKKILFAMLLFVGLLSSLYGLEPVTLNVVCDVEKSQTLSDVNTVVTTVSDEAIAVSAVAQPPTVLLTYSRGKINLDNSLTICIADMPKDFRGYRTCAV